MAQTQTIEAPTRTIPQGWEAVRDALPRAKAMHFDGCHKIYLSLDADQVTQMESYGYDTVTPDFDVIYDWFEGSCGLRFISAVSTVQGDPNKGYADLIPQCWGQDESNDDDEDEQD